MLIKSKKIFSKGIRLKNSHGDREETFWFILLIFLHIPFIIGSLVTLGVILYAINFFRTFATLMLDWNYWLNYDDYKIFNYNYSGIAGVVMTMVLVVFPLLIIFCKLCWNVRKYEKELKETREELKQIQQDRCVGSDIAYAQGGWVNIAIANCFNVHCTCYITVVFASTALAFLSVVAFVCYVLYTYFSK